MEKILLAIDAMHINMKTIDFAGYIANLTHSKLTGIFLEKEELELATVPAMQGNLLNRKQCEENVRLFEAGCKNRGINYSIHHNCGVPVTEIIAESRFADLLIVDAETSFQDDQEAVPSNFIKEVLSKSECPVVVAPYDFYGIDEVLFAYDGSASSVFALKQFTYLFPRLTDKKITVLQVNENGDGSVKYKEKIGELLQTNYSSVGYHILYGKADDKLLNYLVGKKNVFVVMGAFGRTMLSGFFRRSTAELVVKTINLPLFIAHH